MEETKEQFIENMVKYIQSHRNYEKLTKRELVVATLAVLLNDIGAAQRYLNCLNIDIDLYDHTIYKKEDEKDS